MNIISFPLFHYYASMSIILNLIQDDLFQDVAVKILMEQDFHAERCKEFLREVGAANSL